MRDFTAKYPRHCLWTYETTVKSEPTIFADNFMSRELFQETFSSLFVNPYSVE